jgi:D-galactarolactone cycloisomerase
VTTIILARHAETDWNREQRWQGVADHSLNDRGREQARALADELESVPCTAIYASDLRRAHETALVVAERRGLPVTPLPGLREIDYGSWTGLTRDEIKQRFPDGYAKMRTRSGQGWEGGETFAEMVPRVLEAVQRIAREHPGEAVLVVTHSGPIRAVRAHAAGLDFATDRTAAPHSDGQRVWAFEVADGVVRPAEGFVGGGERPRLRITEVRLVRLKTVREIGSLEPAWEPGGRITFRVGGGAYLEIHTEEGLVGIGPAMDPSLLPVVNDLLTGRDPLEIETLAPRLQYHGRGHLRRGTASVDIALWDLIGKASGKPLSELWGAGRSAVPAYASTIRLSSPEEAASLAAELAEEGWKAIKLRLHHTTLEEDLRVVEAVRTEVGDRMEIMADANQAQSPGSWQPGVRWDLPRALATARELEQLGCVWLEEPLPRYAFDELAELNGSVELPIAGGENNRGLHEFEWMLERGVYDILQPDCRVSGGITELREIGARAEAFAKRVAPHHGGGGIGTIAHLHLVAAWPHAPWIELLHEPPIGSYWHRFSIFRGPPTVDETGQLPVPRGPGLGVEIDPELVER